MKTNLPPEHEPMRQAARQIGVAYCVRAGNDYRFECAEDAFIFEPVNVRADCELEQFIATLDSGVI